MGFLDKKTTWNNKELIPLKLCIASIYLLIGAKYETLIVNYKFPLILLFIVTLAYTMYLWLKKMKE
jgi:hypothetical protein